ncbi:MAG TPA: porin [Candidatus Polarisedimenticolia bacterium]|nr:porin [Candidatus Polarisedimenticolia bacterium]
MHRPARRPRLAVSIALLLVWGGLARAQSAPPASSDPTIHTVTDAAEADGDLPKSAFVKFNHYDWKRFSLRWGGGFLWDYSAYSQDEDSQEQLTLRPNDDLRDFRVIVKGKLFWPDRLSYTLGYMYDKAKEDWRWRQTGFMVKIPEWYGEVFIGRTKEGFSTNKIMVGYQGFTMERAAINDALLPILADGIKWTGGIPSGRFVYNLGFFKDTRTQFESFNKNDNQVVARGVWLPHMGTDRSLLHLALQYRRGKSNDGTLQYRSKPESFEAQEYAIDTGKFAADHSLTYGVEAYWRPGPLLVGMEYFFNQVDAPDSRNPLFHGGEIVVSDILTGETRPYNARGAYFERVAPATSVFDGGRGAWELVVRYSYADLSDGPIQGGKFWRLTPMMNWHMSENVRLEFVYGYGMLDRFDLEGATQFFQTRLQLQL